MLFLYIHIIYTDHPSFPNPNNHYCTLRSTFFQVPHMRGGASLFGILSLTIVFFRPIPVMVNDRFSSHSEVESLYVRVYTLYIP